MGRLPIMFAGRPITFRIPFSMPGEMMVLPSQTGLQFPDATFLVSVDKPMEIHRVHISVSAFFDDEGTLVMLDPTPETMIKRIRLKIFDFSKNEALTKNAALVDALTWHNTSTWELEEPYTLVRSEGLQVQIDSQSYGYITYPGAQADPVPIVQARVEVNFQGFLIVIEKPSETR